MDLFLNNVHQCNIVKTLNTHHLQYVISSKKSENLEKSLCTKDEVGRYACDGSSDSTALKTDVITAWTLPGIIVNSSRCHRQTQL